MYEAAEGVTTILLEILYMIRNIIYY